MGIVTWTINCPKVVLCDGGKHVIHFGFELGHSGSGHIWVNFVIGSGADLMSRVNIGSVPIGPSLFRSIRVMSAFFSSK